MASEPTTGNNDAAASSSIVLVESYGRSNIQHRLWYVMSSDDLTDIKASFGDRAYAIKEGANYFYGNDNTWYDSSGDQVIVNDILVE